MLIDILYVIVVFRVSFEDISVVLLICFCLFAFISFVYQKRGVDLPCSSLLHSEVKVPEDGFELKKERRERPFVSNSLEADILNSCDALEDKLQHTEEDTHRVGQDLLVK